MTETGGYVMKIYEVTAKPVAESIIAFWTTNTD
jgi:hypothetical protein